MKYSNKDISPPSKKEKLILRTLILVGVCSLFRFLYYFFNPVHRGYGPLFFLLAIIIAYGALKQLYLWYHYFSISIPKAPEASKQRTVDVLTTYFPGEPYNMVLKTLEAIQSITYPHTTYLCDEANDDFLKQKCRELNVIHVTRDNRINAKAGNINNALKRATGEICLILDPDHIPKPNFLDVVLPYFEDETMGYVQVVQTYYNKPDTLVARGAAEQTFQFYGPLMMTMNSYGTVNAIGANCTFRRSALDSIGGHAPGLAEDMHTAMLLHAKGWKSVYVPKVVAKGLAPADLTSYFKQQLKWSRGTFELLYKVYPKKFSQFTTRQKIHYGLLPLHYLIGFIYLFNFLIPVLSLFFSKMPWKGDLLYFIGVAIPLFTSSLLIGAYAQKWVIEKNERGFHIIGGLLQLSAWWVFLVGVVYTFIRKKVPYLPTPKEEGESIKFLLLIPNLCIALISIIAIVYGLYQNLTPFSLVMASFAFLNVLFMLFSFYLGWKTTNKNQILRQGLSIRTIDNLKRIKLAVIQFSDQIFKLVSITAPLILALSVCFSLAYVNITENYEWNQKTESINIMEIPSFLGVYQPYSKTGFSNLDEIAKFENSNKLKFNMVSLYEAWGSPNDESLKKIIAQGRVPLLTWEPWTTNFNIPDSISDLKQGKKVLHYISQGYFDNYLRQKALTLKSYNSPIFLRFAHEFDNPSYPWSPSGENTPEDFLNAWCHVHNIFDEMGTSNVVWVWSPWKDENMHSYYPGDDVVDWVGLDILNYGTLNGHIQSYSFESLYQPFHGELNKFTNKPVLIAEFGSLGSIEDKEKWLEEAFLSIEKNYNRVKAVVLFNSKYDKNVPEHMRKGLSSLDWSIQSLNSNVLPKSITTIDTSIGSTITKKDRFKKVKTYIPLPPPKGFNGVNYYKSLDWKDNYQVANKNELERDFRLMKSCGIDLIKTTYSSIYAHNIDKYSKESGIKIIYEFHIPKNVDFLSDSTSVRKLKDRIVTAVQKHKNDQMLIAWNIASPLHQYALNLDAAIYSSHRTAFFNWLKDLTDDIRLVDTENLIYLDLITSSYTENDLSYFQNAKIKIDGYSITIKDADSSKSIRNLMKGVQSHFIFGSTSLPQIKQHKPIADHSWKILENWQNRWQTNFGTLDGLLDFNGNLKEEYLETKNYFKKTSEVFHLPQIRIMRPAVPLLPSKKVTYYAYYKSKGKWLIPDGLEAKKYTWMLAKLDNYENIIALKRIGEGKSLEINVPESYEDYLIILLLKDKGYSISFDIELNTPLIRQ